jgi:hypothetical protein
MDPVLVRNLAAVPFALCLASCGGGQRPAKDAPPAEEAAPSPTPPPAPQAPERASILFEHIQIPKTTTVESFSASWVMTATRSFDGASRTSDLTVESREERTFTPLEKEGDTAYLLAFGQAGVTILHDGEQKTTPSLLAGNTYRVVIEGGSARITDERGGHVPRAEGKLLAKRLSRVREVKEALVGLTSGPVRVGDRSEPVEQLLRQEAGGGLESAGFGNVAATLMEVKEIDGARSGVFDVQLQVAFQASNGLTFANDLHGKVVVRGSDSTFSRVDLTGPCQITGTLEGVAIHAEGKAVERLRARTP